MENRCPKCEGFKGGVEFVHGVIVPKYEQCRCEPELTEAEEELEKRFIQEFVEFGDPMLGSPLMLKSDKSMGQAKSFLLQAVREAEKRGLVVGEKRGRYEGAESVVDKAQKVICCKECCITAAVKELDRIREENKIE